MSLRLFPDVNVWVALHHELHAHHGVANGWFDSLDRHSILIFCRQTQMGLFRLLTTEAVMGDETLTQKQCWTLYGHWLNGGKGAFRAEPAGQEEAFQSRTTKDTSSPKEWMDAYLAAFAELSGLRIVTFDRALAGKAKGSVLLG